MLNKIVNSKLFQNLILFFILLNALLIGLETSSEVMLKIGDTVELLNFLCLWIFILEILLRILANRFAFFKEGWNLFDLLIIIISLMPDNGVFSVFRILRTIRVLRLLSIVPKMRLISQALLSSLSPMFGVGILLLILFYIYAIISTHLYGERFPEWFGSIGESFYTLFQIMTFESWSMGIVRPLMDIYPYSWVVFVSFLLFASYIVLNIAIGIIVDCIGDIKANEADKNQKEILSHISSLEEEIKQLKSLLDKEKK